MSAGQREGRARRVVVVVVSALVAAVTLVAVVAHVRAGAEVSRMDAVVDELSVPAGWTLSDVTRTTPPLGLCIYSVQACPSTHLTYTGAPPLDALDALLPGADWEVEEPDCAPPAEASGSWTSCAATTEVDGFTVHASVSGATFDDAVALAVDIAPNGS